ncbi:MULTISPECIES: AAA family ATPase [Mycolicibacterium]|jgi:Cdc6-like AAA superfamily ATPase|uniref:AAA family ATPase n=1 Tax=Mycolicibacterium TaxID=1866885 RepID=UPI001CA30F34|nr:MULTISPECIES: ATP-binding protein [Mycolicibacterium]MDW5611928.1 ATP-binding protein [Mycolicibacterium sp. D5.8-2]QZT63771.1 ATP-binding protein [Mycolicibacterium austroafricanum]
MRPEAETKLARRMALNKVFTPSAPVSSRSAFSGRIDQIMQITSAVVQPGRHAILYGERGVGKTSLANILSELLVLTENTYRNCAVRVNCSVGDNFRSIWTKIFLELDIDCTSYFPDYETPNPDQLRRILSLVEPYMVVVVDEYDRVDDDEALSMMADTIKALSDHAVPTKLVFVGVADSIENLIGEHESVRRCLEEVQVPRMKAEEMRELVTRGFFEADIQIEKSAVERIVRLSEGLPPYGHLLSLRAGERAVNDDRESVFLRDVIESAEAVMKSHSAAASYHHAVESSRPENLYAQVLAACALAEKDELGYFAAKAVEEPMSRIMGSNFKTPSFSRQLSSFLGETRGYVLERRGEMKRYRYRFRDPLMQPFAILAAIARELIPDEYQRELFDVGDEVDVWGEVMMQVSPDNAAEE